MRQTLQHIQDTGGTKRAHVGCVNVSPRILPSVLVLDPDPGVRGALSEYLGMHGISVSLAARAEDAEEVLASESIDLVFMDILLPDADGLHLCRALAGQRLSIIIGSSIAEEADRVIGLEFGADDYLVKPFGMREALARIRAVLRRRSTEVATPAEHPAHGGFVLDGRDRRVVSESTGESVLLTIKEYALLKRFMNHPHETLTRDRLAGDPKRDPHDLRAIDVQVSRLRHKFRKALSTDLIETVRHFGYMLVADIKIADESAPQQRASSTRRLRRSFDATRGGAPQVAAASSSNL